MAWFRDHVTGRHEVPLSDIFTAERLQRVVTEPETMYGGLSLRYVRHLIGNPPPEASSSLAMMNKYKDRLQREPVVGMVCFWWGGPSDTHGDVGLVVSPLRALTVGYDGRPYFKQIARDDYEGSMWWPGTRGHA